MNNLKLIVLRKRDARPFCATHDFTIALDREPLGREREMSD